MVASASAPLSLVHPKNVGGHQGSERQHAYKEEEAAQVHQQARQAEVGVEEFESDFFQPQVAVSHSMPWTFDPLP